MGNEPAGEIVPLGDMICESELVEVGIECNKRTPGSFRFVSQPGTSMLCWWGSFIKFQSIAALGFEGRTLPSGGTLLIGES